MIQGSDSQDQFYLTLPSNSSLSYYGKQERAHYLTKLHGSVHLDPTKWLVGLAEITFPKTYNNVPDCVFTAEYLPNDLPDDDPFETMRCEMPGKHYLSPNDFLREWRDAYKADDSFAFFKDNLKLSYEKTGQRVTLDIEPGFYLRLPYPLVVAMGFRETDGDPYEDDNGSGLRFPKQQRPNSRASTKIKAHHPVDPDRLVPVIYAYCDLIERQRVGDAYVQLLRTLTVPGRVPGGGELVTRTFHNIHYGQVERGSFETVEIHLVDEQGINIPFLSGDVIVKLHFKRKT